MVGAVGIEPITQSNSTAPEHRRAALLRRVCKGHVTRTLSKFSLGIFAEVGFVPLPHEVHQHKILAPQRIPQGRTQHPVPQQFVPAVANCFFRTCSVEVARSVLDIRSGLAQFVVPLRWV